MSEDLHPDVAGHLEAARDELTSSLPRPDARIDALLGAGPPLAGHAGPPSIPDPTIEVPLAPPAEPSRRRRRLVAVAAAAIALVGLGAGAALVRGDSAETLDAAQGPPSAEATPAALADPSVATDPGEGADGTDADQAPPLPEPVDDLLSEHKEWLTCVSGELHRFLDDGEPGAWSLGDLHLDTCGSPPAFEDPLSFAWPDNWDPGDWTFEDWNFEDWTFEDWSFEDWDPESWLGEWDLEEWQESFELRFPPDFWGEWWGTEPGEADPDA